MDWMAELQAVLPPPAQHEIVATPLDWTATERYLGRDIPGDYKTFLQTYGDGSWNSFILFFLPGQDREEYALPHEARLQDQVYAGQKASFPDEFTMPLLPAHGSLMPFARTENGDYLGWIVGPESSDDWPVAVLAHEFGVAERFEMGFAEFLTRLTKGDVKPDGFPADLDHEPVSFLPAVPWDPSDG